MTMKELIRLAKRIGPEVDPELDWRTFGKKLEEVLDEYSVDCMKGVDAATAASRRESATRKLTEVIFDDGASRLHLPSDALVPE